MDTRSGKSRAGNAQDLEKTASGAAMTDAPPEFNASLANNITITQDNFAMLLLNMQQSQAEMCTRFIEEIRGTNRESTPAMESSLETSTTVSHAGANFALCQAKFTGSAKESVENFIDAVEIYKTATNMSELCALRGLSLLLSNDAGTWWQGVKKTVTTWQEAMHCLRSAFGERRPPFQVYRDLFSMTQGQQTTDLFVAQARALLARIPEGELSVKTQLDMVFGLLDIRIRKRVDRESVSSFSDLLRRARSIEDALVESGVRGLSTSKPAHRPPAPRSTQPSAPVAQQAPSQPSSGVAGAPAPPASSGDSDSGYTAILQRATYKVGLLTIQGVSTCLYLCMDACGFQYAHKDLSEDCVFEEHIEENNYNTYSRIRAGKKTYLALDNRGKARRTQIPVSRPLGNLSTYALTMTRRWEGPRHSQCPPRRHRGKLKTAPKYHRLCQRRVTKQNIRLKRKHKKVNDSKKKRHPKTRRKFENSTTTTTESWEDATMSTMSTTTDAEFFRSGSAQEALGLT